MTFHPFHQWIEPTSTSATVVLAFGGWWDADEVAGGGGSVGTVFRSPVIRGPLKVCA